MTSALSDDTAIHPAQALGLPDDLYWIGEKVASLVRPAAFLRPDGERSRRTGAAEKVASMGATHRGPFFDVPQDAPWAKEARRWDQSPHDGPSCYLQLNLGSVPQYVREQIPRLPRDGVVWVVVDLREIDEGSIGSSAHFDPRPASQIPWQPREATSVNRLPQATRWERGDTLTCWTPLVLPELGSYQSGFVQIYDEWWQSRGHFRHSRDIQLGGWLHPIQGDADEERRTLVLSIGDAGFGDCGEVYLHYSAERGFWVETQSC